MPFRPKPHDQKNPDAKSTGKKKCQLKGEDNNLGYEIHKNQQNPWVLQNIKMINGQRVCVRSEGPSS